MLLHSFMRLLIYSLIHPPTIFVYIPIHELSVEDNCFSLLYLFIYLIEFSLINFRKIFLFFFLIHEILSHFSIHSSIHHVICSFQFISFCLSITHSFIKDVTSLSNLFHFLIHSSNIWSNSLFFGTNITLTKGMNTKINY